MHHVNYERWALYIHNIAKKVDKEIKWIVDISCGTGSCIKELSRFGYKVTGYDSSIHMLREAHKKYKNKNIFFCAEMGFPPLRKSPDMIISLYDSINYLMLKKQWQICLKNIYEILENKGIFVFDTSTLYNSQQDFSKYVHKESFAKGSYFRKSRFIEKKNIQENIFKIRLAKFPRVIFYETHVQKILSISQVLELIKRSSFKLLAAYKDFTSEPYNERCERVHFVLEK